MAEYGSMTNNDIKNTLSSYSGIGSVASSVPKMNKSKTKKPSYGASTTYTRPSYNVLSVQDALTQARSQLDPMKDLAVARVQESYEKEKNRLPQYLNARGQGLGGARIIGEKNLYDDENRQINDINTQNNAQVASLAQQLVQRSQDRADSQAAQDFSQWATIQNMLENRYGNEMAQYNADRNYDYQTGRDLIGDQRYADELAYNKENAQKEYDWKTNPTTWANTDAHNLALAQIAAANRSNTGGGGGGGMTVAQQLALMKYQDSQNAARETIISKYVNDIVKLLQPKTNQQGVQMNNTYYRNGHAYPREALQSYKSLIGNDDIYNEVYNRIMGQYDKNANSFFK